MNRKQWQVVAMLFLATVLNYVDRQTLSVLAPELRDRFHMSNTDYSHVVFGFLLAYMVMQSGSGRLLDRLGTKAGFAVCIGWWSGATMLHALANSMAGLLGGRFLLGLGEAGNWPGGVKAVSEWCPPKQRAFAIGVFNSGSCFGAVLAPPVVAWLALTWGWRTAFVVAGLPGFLWLAVWLATYRTPAGAVLPEAAATKVSWAGLFRYRQVWALLLARMTADPVWWFYVFWLPEYLKRERHFTLAAIGYFAWIPFLSAAAGSIGGGAASGWLIRRGVPVLRARKFVMAASAVVMMSGIPAVFVASSAAALALISLATLAYSVWAANVLTLPADVAPASVVASVSGISGTGAAIGGMAFTLLTGVLVDHFSYVPVFLAAGTLPLIALCAILAGVRARL